MDVSRNLAKLAAEPESSFASEAARLGKRHLKRVVSLVGAVESGGAEAVHDMRVASRRIREVLRLQRDFAGSKRIKSLLRFARVLGRLLGAVRGDDVMLLGLRDVLSGDALHTVAVAVSMRRVTHHAELKELLKSGDFDEWRKNASDAFGHPPSGNDLVREVAPRLIKRTVERVLSHEGITGDAEFADLHALRIHAKRLRYALEFFGHSLLPSTPETIDRLAELQDHLGALHDDVLLLGELQTASSLDLWSPEQLNDLHVASGKVESRISNRRRQAASKWSFISSEAFAKYENLLERLPFGNDEALASQEPTLGTSWTPGGPSL